jgi:hypothetical protein
MAVKSNSKAKTTEFEKLVASYAERVNNGELTPLKAMQYREFGDVLSGSLYYPGCSLPEKLTLYTVCPFLLTKLRLSASRDAVQTTSAIASTVGRRHLTKRYQPNRPIRKVS